MPYSRHSKLSPTPGFLHFFLLVLVEDFEVGAPADEFLGGHGGADFGQAHEIGRAHV